MSDDTFLFNKKIILGVSGSIATYKAIELLRLLVKLGARVHVVMSANAVKFVTPLTFEALRLSYSDLVAVVRQLSSGQIRATPWRHGEKWAKVGKWCERPHKKLYP